MFLALVFMFSVEFCSLLVQVRQIRVDRFTFHPRFAISSWDTEANDGTSLVHFSPNQAFYRRDLEAVQEAPSHFKCVKHMLGLGVAPTESFEARVLLQRWRFVFFLTAFVLFLSAPSRVVLGMHGVFAVVATVCVFRWPWTSETILGWVCVFLVDGVGESLLHFVVAYVCVAMVFALHCSTQSLALVPTFNETPLAKLPKRQRCACLRRECGRITVPWDLFKNVIRYLSLDRR